MYKVIALTGGLSNPSSSRVLADDLAHQFELAIASRGEQVEVEMVELRDHAHAIVDTMLTGFPTGDFARLMERVVQADAMLVVTPTFSAGISGLVKSFFDVVEKDALTSMPVLMAATGGTERHSLVIEYAMRPLFAYLGARPGATGVYAATSDFGGEGAAALRRRVERAAEDLAQEVAGSGRRARGDDFVDFETLLARKSA